VNRLTLDQIVPYQQWEELRAVLRPLFLVEKERRRLTVGEHVTLLFENVQSVWYQIEEMLRVERITEPALMQHEVDTYNGLLPGAGELSATMLIAYPEAHERDAALRRLVGLERHVWLRIGERRVQAEFDTEQLAPDVVSAVQFLRFAIGGRAAERLVDLAAAGALAIEFDHPELVAATRIGPELARALADDLNA